MSLEEIQKKIVEIENRLNIIEGRVKKLEEIIDEIYVLLRSRL